MSILLDTHAFLWWVLDDRRLGPDARATIMTTDQPVCLSLVSIWEIAVKQGLGRRVSGAGMEEIMDVAFTQEQFREIGLGRPELTRLEALPQHHADPFDRLLIVQAQVYGMQLMTGDAAFGDYAVDLIDARI